MCRTVRRYTTVFSNSGCTPWATHSCFAGWPAHTPTLPQRLLLVLSFSYYLYELAGLAVGVGTALKYDMVAHHVVCMTLFVIGCVDVKVAARDGAGVGHYCSPSRSKQVNLNLIC